MHFLKEIEMTLDELRARVPLHSDRFGKPHFISLNDVPEPWRSQFQNAIRGSACPQIQGFSNCAFAVDWIDWLSGNWRDHHSYPMGLDI